jgi:hypothetical protein
LVLFYFDSQPEGGSMLAFTQAPGVNAFGLVRNDEDLSYEGRRSPNVAKVKEVAGNAIFSFPYG